MPTPLISVICIFHDEELYLEEAIESVLEQDFQDFELLLVDDGSTDGSAGIARAREARHPGKIRYLTHPDGLNHGMSATRNLGLRHARGAYLAMIDGDDRWTPGKLSEQLALLKAHPDVGMVCGGYVDWKSWAGGEDELNLAGPVTNGKSFPPMTTLKVYPLGRSCNPTNPLIRREVVERAGGYEDAFRGLYEDQVFLAKLYLETGVYWSNKVWLLYRRHPESCTMQITRADYVAARTQFLDWLSGYVAARDVPRRGAIERAIAFARWELRHRYLAYGYKRARVQLLKLAKAVGFVDFYRRYRHGG